MRLRVPVTSAIPFDRSARMPARESGEGEATVRDKHASAVPRRSFLSRLGLGMTAYGALAPDAVMAQAPAAGPRWQPGRHAQDDWLDQLPGQHRFVFDTTQFDGLGGALLYANNFFVANKNGYDLGDADLAVVIVVRHNSTAFAYNDAMWGKYGGPMAERANVKDPGTKQAPKVNLFNAASLVAQLPSGGNTLDSLLKRGVHLAVCQMATRRYAGVIAQAAGGSADAVYTELTSNLVSNAHMVPAGIVAVNRAQERGYSFTNVGV
jgi:intracellular sulfur oxidation DsrE/DsrF family protein